MSAPVESRLAALAEESLAVEDLEAALPHLRRPFAPAAVRWKVQSAGDGWGIVIAYIDARLVIERLNLVVGPHWSDEYRGLDKGVEECALTLFGVTRRDVGIGQGIQGAKATRSDALKRAGVKFGVGVSIYALKAVLLSATPGNEPVEGKPLVKNRSKTVGQKTVWSAQLSKAAERWLAEMYERWLGERAVELFGPPLDHGDEAGAAGMEGEEGATAGAAEEPAGEGEVEVRPALTDERAEQLRAKIAQTYGELRKLDAAVVPPAAHRVELEAAAGSHEELEALLAKRVQQLETRRAKAKPKAKPAKGATS